VTGLASATAGGGDGGEAGAGVRSCSSSHGATAAAAAEGTQVLVEEMWKPGKELRPVFEALGLAHDALYTAAVRTLLCWLVG
jgi:translation initiation factor 2D